jgi:hypothetical protein
MIKFGSIVKIIEPGFYMGALGVIINHEHNGVKSYYTIRMLDIPGKEVDLKNVPEYKITTELLTKKET